MLVELVAFHDEPHTRLLASDEISRCLSRCGIADAHYLAVSQAVSAVLTHALEACATPAARAAWHEAYDLLTAIVRRAANRRDGRMVGPCELTRAKVPCGWRARTTVLAGRGSA